MTASSVRRTGRTIAIALGVGIVTAGALVAPSAASATPVCAPGPLGTTVCTYTNIGIVEAFYFPPGLQSFYATAVGERGEGNSAPASKASSLIEVSSLYPSSDAVAILVGAIGVDPPGAQTSRGPAGTGTPAGNRGGAFSTIVDTACCAILLAGGSGGGGSSVGAGADASPTTGGAGGVAPGGTGGAGLAGQGGPGAPGGAQPGGSGGGGGMYGGGGGAPGAAGGRGSSLGQTISTSPEPASIEICYGFDPWSNFVCQFTIGSGSS